ncbi:MAG: DUF2865 domain-containing protein [Allorhizobium sp.]
MSTTQTIGNNGADVRRYSSALTQQNFEIRKARRDLQALNCGTGSIIVFDASGKSACLELSNALERMEDNKRLLEEKRDMLRNDFAADGDERQRLMAAIEDNDCNGTSLDQAANDYPSPTMPPSSGDIGMQEMAPDEGDEWPEDRPYDGSGLGIGSLRTLCVRTCDGAFFPISANATPLNFNRDAGICEQMCPGTETELFYHSIRNQESADMVSATTGEPYRQMPTAFAYLNRQSGEKPACSCNLTAYYQKMRARQSNAVAKPEAPYSAITKLPGDTVAKPSPAPAESTPPPPDRPYDAAAGHVRQVGPIFIPPETSSIDLRNPAAPGAQPLQQ